MIRFFQSEDAQGLVEFALVIPVLVLSPGAIVHVPLPRQTGGDGNEASTEPK